MSLPGFTASGDLEPGVHTASLAVALDRFGRGSDARARVATRLQRIYRIAVATGHVLRFVVFGSFVTTKELPNDVDVFMIMDDDFDYGSLEGESRLLFDHATAQDRFGASVFWVRRIAALGGEKAAVEDWQLKRDGTRRGIVEIVSE